ncbi:hypothetical protein V6N12_003339 [Hibiscus sabdariffa]|uniref:Uncharacterized protein n=1 Tax=Hibiscus sabdariffa TaxID=183260 RepID=A0ABR2EBM4_9ROSI
MRGLAALDFVCEVLGSFPGSASEPPKVYGWVASHLLQVNKGYNVATIPFATVWMLWLHRNDIVFQGVLRDENSSTLMEFLLSIGYGFALMAEIVAIKFAVERFTSS